VTDRQEKFIGSAPVLVPCREKSMQTKIGTVSHYYPKIGVAAVVLKDHLARGDRIHIHGPNEDFDQSVTSMEQEHIPITEADAGQDIGIKVSHPVHVGDVVCRET
jgi:translation elongation factor EF-1alpha